jgi:hypothetical protein
MPKKITKYQCEYCKKSYMRINDTFRHEKECFYNPDREPRDFELAIWKTMPESLIITDSYGVPGSDFRDIHYPPYSEHEKKYMPQLGWWPLDEEGSPQLGFYWLDGKWNKIEGYESPNFAPRLSWRDEKIPDSFWEMMYKDY